MVNVSKVLSFHYTDFRQNSLTNGLGKFGARTTTTFLKSTFGKFKHENHVTYEYFLEL